ncbi:MAG: hflC, partial [Gammaproteobacteria bacterium]|nr:hflC [Gammaproteobacteria bacterium]
MKAKNILISLAGIGLIAAYFSCTNIEPYQQGAIFTKDNLKILQPGFYVTVPLIQNVQKIDMRMQSTTLSSIAVSTQDHNNVLLDVVVVWKVVDAGDYAKATQANSQQIDKWLSQAVSPVVQKALAQKTLSQLLGSSSNNLASQLLASLSQNAQQQGIQLIDINIQNISFAPNMLDKVYQAMQASSQQAVSQINAQG